MLVIRFLRMGKKNQPFFKIVVADKRQSSKAGRLVEQIGFFDPLTKQKNIKAERVKYWIQKGAQPSERVHNLLIQEKVIEGKKIAVHKKSKKEKNENVKSPEKTAESTEVGLAKTEERAPNPAPVLPENPKAP